MIFPNWCTTQIEGLAGHLPYYDRCVPYPKLFDHILYALFFLMLVPFGACFFFHYRDNRLPFGHCFGRGTYILLHKICLGRCALEHYPISSIQVLTIIYQYYFYIDIFVLLVLIGSCFYYTHFNIVIFLCIWFSIWS